MDKKGDQDGSEILDGQSRKTPWKRYIRNEQRSQPYTGLERVRMRRIPVSKSRPKRKLTRDPGRNKKKGGA